jgi:hypothetical protein
VTRKLAAGQWAQLLIEDQPELFDPLMRYFFLEVIGEGRPIHGGPGDPGVLRDHELRALVESYPELTILDEGELADQLCQRAEAIIKQGLKRRK